MSWIRRRDWHIMSSGTTVYTADSRFSVINRPGSPDWILMLKSPQLHDSGTYECQVCDTIDNLLLIAARVLYKLFSIT